jgi:PAS domain S-box-containing protein
MNQRMTAENLDHSNSAFQKLMRQLESAHQRCRQLQLELKETEDRYSSLVDNIPDIVYAMDDKACFIKINKAVTTYGFSQEELIGRPFYSIVCDEDRLKMAEIHDAIIGKKNNITDCQQFRVVVGTGEARWFQANFNIRYSAEGRFLFHEGVCRDITENVRFQDLLLRHQEELEALVKNRTNELTQVNEALQNEIIERIETEKALREREADLQIEKDNLQEANTALRVLLKRREMDKRELEEQVLYNVKELVQPYLDKLKLDAKDTRNKAFISIIESNLNDITSAFSRRLAIDFYDLTKSELKVASFIRQGKRSHQIADILGLSVRTVEAYRNSIRRKLRIKKRKINLRTFLLSIS